MGARRRRKHYGPVHGLARRAPEVPDWARKRAGKVRESQGSYAVAKGTPCHIRKIGSKEWESHRTIRDLVCVGFLWRNRTHYGFTQGEYEFKVPLGKFREMLGGR